MTEFEKGYEQGYKDGTAGAALPNVNDNGDKIDGYGYAYKTDSRGEPYIHIDSVRNMLKKAADVQPVTHAYWIELPKALNPNENPCKCSNCGHILSFMNYYPKSKYCPNCGARMDLKDGDTNG
jgi:NADH pyrophosphatase NudC (nudix superfamily)